MAFTYLYNINMHSHIFNSSIFKINVHVLNYSFLIFKKKYTNRCIMEFNSFLKYLQSPTFLNTFSVCAKVESLITKHLRYREKSTAKKSQERPWQD
jgi:hypothetical protein